MLVLLFVWFLFDFVSLCFVCVCFCACFCWCVWFRFLFFVLHLSLLLCCGFVLCFLGDSTDVSLFLNLRVSPGLVVSCFVFLWACVVCLRLCLDVDLYFAHLVLTDSCDAS